MPASSNESQGLKIAVAVFIALSVILSVTCYFLYSAYAAADAQRQKAADDLGKARTAASEALNQFEDMRNKIGTKAQEADPAKDEITAHLKKAGQRTTNLVNLTNTAIQKAQAAGGPAQELNEVRARVQRIAASYNNDPSKTYMSSLDRLLELMEAFTTLNGELSTDNYALRQKLESATSVAKGEVDLHAKSAEASKADLEEEHKKHDEQRQILVDKVSEQQNRIDQQRTEQANLQGKYKQTQDDYFRERELLTTSLREWRDKAERNDTILDRPDGRITYVDYEVGEVHVDVTRRMGARPQMVLSVFDQNSPGIPTEKPKGTIELTQVGDKFSVARIIKTVNSADPFWPRDIVYSPAWSPNTPTKFALVGKMDVNRDGRDDRDELKRLIEEAGGEVVFDLPPPALGKETGKITPLVDWYVVDERPPLRSVTVQRNAPVLSDETALAKRVGEITKECRLEGIRPMPIGKLLNFLGYDINTPIYGREAVNDKAVEQLTRPLKKPGVVAPPAAEAGEVPAEGQEPAAEPATEMDEPPAGKDDNAMPNEDQ